MQGVIRYPCVAGKNCFLHRNRTVSRRNISFAVKLSVVRLILLQNVVDGRQQHPSNGNNSFLVTSALLNRKIPIADFRIALNPNSTECALNQQWLNVSARSGNSGSLFLPALSLFCGVSPAHEHKCLEEGNTDISTPISAITEMAEKVWIPSTDITRLS